MQRYILGIDLSADLQSTRGKAQDQIKFALIQKGLFKDQIVKEHILACPEGDTASKLELALNHIQETLHPGPDEIIIGLDSRELLFFPLILPFDKGRKMNSVLRFELENELPVSMDGFSWDYCLLGKKGNLHHFLAALAPKELIQVIGKKIQEHGLTLSRIEVDLLLLPRLGQVLQQAGHENFLLLQPGRNKTNILWQNGQCPLILRSLPIGLEEITPLGQANHSRTRQVPELVQLARRELVSQIKLSLSAAKGDHLPETCLLLGQGEPTIALQDVLEPGLGLTVTSIRPGENVPSIAQFLVNHQSQGKYHSLQTNFWNSTLGKSKTWIDFSQSLQQKKQGFFQAGITGSLASALGLILLAWGLAFAFRLHLEQKELHILESKVESIFKQLAPRAPKYLKPIQYLSVLQNKLNQAQNNYTGPQAKGIKIIYILDLLTQTLPQEMKITMLNVFQDQIKIIGQAKDYNRIDLFKKKLGKSRLIKKVKIIGANLDQNKDQITFSLGISTD